MRIAGLKSHSPRPCNGLRTEGLIQRHGLANGSIIIALRPSPRLDAGVLRAPRSAALLNKLVEQGESRCTRLDSAEVAYDADCSSGCIRSFRHWFDPPPDL